MRRCFVVFAKTRFLTDSAMKILIVTYNWPPRNAIGTHRPLAWAKTWAAEGHAIRVITAKKSSFDAPLDMAECAIPNVNVIQTSFWDMKIMLTKIVPISLLKKIRKLVFGQRANFSREAADPRGGWADSITQSELEAHACWADVVVSTFGPAAAHEIAYKIKNQRPDVCWVADYRDLWSQRHIYEPDAAQERYEKQLMLQADLVTTVSKGFAKSLENLLGRDVEVFRNGHTHTEDVVSRNISVNRVRSRDRKTLVMVYTGNIYFGFQDPEPLMLAIESVYAEIKALGFEIRVEFYGARQTDLEVLSSKYKFLHLCGHRGHDEILEIQRDADVLLLFESDQAVSDGTIPAKIYEYLAAAAPILLIGPPAHFELTEIVVGSGLGTSFAYGDLEGISAYILDKVTVSEAKELVSPDSDLIMSYSRHASSLKLLRHITRLVP